MKTLTLDVREGRYAVCRLDPGGEPPPWATRGGFFSVTRTAEELSVVCDEREVPGGVRYEGGWSCLTVRGPLELSSCGVLSSLSAPLADAGIPVFAVSTHDTDHLLVKHRDLDRAIAALARRGHTVARTP